jgi:ribosomal-protein-alanine N-acetyltransferase
MIDHGFGVTLRTLDQSDMIELRDWRNELKIRQWCRQVGLISDLDQEKWFKSQNDDPTIRMFGILDPYKTLCGVCGLTSIDLINRRAEFSLYIAPDAHGRGLGRAALRTLCLFGFLELGLNIIWGESFEKNKAVEIFKAVGFSHEGVRRDFYFKDGRFISADLWSLRHKELLL